MAVSKHDLNYFRNPLIGNGIGETQINIQAAMSLLKQLQSEINGNVQDLTSTSNRGLSLFNTCILQAIEYEMTYRSDN